MSPSNKENKSKKRKKINNEVDKTNNIRVKKSKLKNKTNADKKNQQDKYENSWKNNVQANTTSSGVKKKDIVDIQKKHKNKKKRQLHDLTVQEFSYVDSKSGYSVVPTKKKKKSKTVEHVNLERKVTDPSMDHKENNLQKRQKKMKDKNATKLISKETENLTAVDNGTNTKKVKKKKRKEIKKSQMDVDANRHCDSSATSKVQLEDNKKTSSETSLAGKKEKNKKTDNKPSTGASEKTMKRKKSSNTLDNSGESNSKRKKKQKQQSNESATNNKISKAKSEEVKTVSETKRNDAKSNKIVVMQNEKGGKMLTEENKFGQWTNVNFGDQAKQDKFLRLLGGNKAQKNPNSKKLWSGTDSRNFSSMALNKTQSESLSNKLQEQYTNVLAFNLQKRNENNLTKGLGFKEDPSKGKKFYIDIGKSNSIKFED